MQRSKRLVELHLDLIKYFEHLIFDGASGAGGYWASQFCQHTWHRVALAIGSSLITTLLLVLLVS